MRLPRRPLSVEPFEERSLPSASQALAHFDHASEVAKVARADSPTHAFATPVFTIWEGRLITPDGSVFRVRILVESRLFLRFDSSSDSDNARSGGQTSSNAFSNNGDNDFAAGAQTRATTPARTNSVEQRGSSPAAAVVPPPEDAIEVQAGPAATPAAAAQTQSAAAAAGAPVAAQFLSGQLVALPTAGRALGGELIDLSDAAPPTIPPAVPSEGLPASPAVPPEDPAPDWIVDAPVPSILPVAGALPIDLATIGVSAANFLGRMADLDVAWPDDMPGFEDYVWSAAAVLLAGGALYGATGSRSDQSARQAAASASALAEWEGKNVGRPY